MATVGSAIVCDRLRLYGNSSLLRSSEICDLRSAIVCDRLRSYGNQPLGGLIIYNLLVKTVVRCLRKSSFGLKVRHFETQTSRQLQVPAAVCVMQRLETIPRNKFPLYLFSEAYIENLQYTVLSMLSIPS